MSPSEPSLTLTVPIGWRVANLDALFGQQIPDAMITVLGDDLDPGEAEALRAEFRNLHGVVEVERIVFMALRDDPQTGLQDVMMLALPSSARPPQVVSPMASEGGQMPEGPVETVSLNGDAAVVHRSLSGATTEDRTGSWVQLVRYLPGTPEGAILTITSPRPDREEELAEEAEEVARSFDVTADRTEEQ